MSTKLDSRPLSHHSKVESPRRVLGRRPRVLIVAAAVALLALMIFGYVLSKNYKVLAEGALLPYTDGKVARLRLFDAVTLYVAKERTRPLDVLNVVLFAMTAGVSFFTLVLLDMLATARGKVAAFFVVALVGAVWLAADEGIGIHETIGYNLDFLRDVPGVHRPDDLVFAAYGIPALVIVVVFRKVILASRAAVACFAAALALFVAAAFFDVVGIGLDEICEPMSTACLLAGFTLIALREVRTAI